MDQENVSSDDRGEKVEKRAMQVDIDRRRKGRGRQEKTEKYQSNTITDLGLDQGHS